MSQAQVIDPKTVNADGKVVFGATLNLMDNKPARSDVPDRRRLRSRHRAGQDFN